MKKVVIYGEYWDSYIYSNNLILIGSDHTVKVINWEQIIKSKIINKNKALAYNCLFLNGDYLYNSRLYMIFEDKDEKELLLKKFIEVENIEIQSNEIKENNKYGILEIKTLPTDIGIYDNTLYYINSKGLFFRKLSKQNKNYISNREQKLWDGHAQCIKIGSNARIALSAQDDGLFEYNNFEYDIYSDKSRTDTKNIFCVIKKNSQFCDWCYSSISSTSINQNFYVLKYNYKYREYISTDYKTLAFDKAYSENEIFRINEKLKNKKTKEIAFGNYDKVYSISENGIKSYHYYQNGLSIEETFKYIDFIKLNEKINGRIIRIESAFFGIIVETEIDLIVITDKGKIYNLNPKKEEVVDWRLFNRSKRYINQIHVVFLDRIEIISFYEDYFINQKEKKLGAKYDEKYLNRIKE